LRKLLLIVALTAVGALASVAATSAASISLTPCPQGYACLPAAVTVTTSSSSSSHVHIKVVKTVKEKITQYEKLTHKKVAIYQNPLGVASVAGCVDPINKGWIKSGGSFRNTRSNGSPFWTYWKAGWGICDAHRVVINGFVYMEGTKQNCGNKNILLPLGPAPKHVTYPEVEFRTVKSFVTTYDKYVRKHATSSTTTTTTYSCAYLGTGWQQYGDICIKPNVSTPTPSAVSCTLSVSNAPKSSPETAQAVVSVSGSPVSITINWGDTTSTDAAASTVTDTHTYPTPAASTQPNAGVTYAISAMANVAGGGTVPCTGGGSFFIPAPLPPSAPNGGGSNPPPPPPG